MRQRRLMARSSYRFGGVISVSLTLIVLAFPVAAAQQSTNQQWTQTSSTGSAQKSAPKLHVKKGSKDDIDAIGKRSIASGLNWSLDKEIALGKEDAILIESRYKRLDDPSINQYIDRIGQNLVRNSDAKVPFTIK